MNRPERFRTWGYIGAAAALVILLAASMGSSAPPAPVEDLQVTGEDEGCWMHASIHPRDGERVLIDSETAWQKVVREPTSYGSPVSRGGNVTIYALNPERGRMETLRDFWINSECEVVVR